MGKVAFTIHLKPLDEVRKSVRREWAFRPTERVVQSKKVYSRKGYKVSYE